MEAKTCVIFRIDQAYYAIDVLQVAGIESYTDYRKLSGAPKFLPGVVEFRNEILPMVSIRCHLGLPEIQPGDSSKLIMTKINGQNVALMADEVLSISAIEFRTENVSFSMGIMFRCVSKVTEFNGKVVIMLDYEKLMTDEEKKQFLQFVEELQTDESDGI